MFSGLAHLDPRPFGNRAPWGGSAWRSRRQFVGRVTYGAHYLLWSPQTRHKFPSRFRSCSREFNLSLLRCTQQQAHVLVNCLTLSSPLSRVQHARGHRDVHSQHAASRMVRQQTPAPRALVFCARCPQISALCRRRRHRRRPNGCGNWSEANNGVGRP